MTTATKGRARPRSPFMEGSCRSIAPTCRWRSSPAAPWRRSPSPRPWATHRSPGCRSSPACTRSSCRSCCSPSSAPRATSSSARTRRRPAILRDRPRRHGPRRRQPDVCRDGVLAALMRGACCSSGARPAPRLHRQLPVAQRPHRLPHRRRHPGGDGPGRRHVRGPEPIAAATIEKFIETLKLIPSETQVRRPSSSPSRSWARSSGSAAVEQEDPGRPHRGHRRHRPELRPGPLRQGRHDHRSGARGSAAARPADRGHDHQQLLGPAADRRLDLHRHPGPERRDLACVRHEVLRQASMRTSTSSASASPTWARASPAPSWSTAARPRPQMVDSAGGRNQIAQLTAGGRSSWSCCCS